MGGDAELMAGIITAQTMISMLTLPVVLILL
jgi:predicted permease